MVSFIFHLIQKRERLRRTTPTLAMAMAYADLKEM